MNNIYTELDKFIAKHQQQPITYNSTITSQRISQILTSIISSQFQDSSSFQNEYFKEIIHQVGATILSIVYRKQQIFNKIEHFVAYVSIIQFTIHNETVELPALIGNKLQKYVHSLIVLQDLLKIKTIYLDSTNSNILSNFYKHIYINAFQFRYRSQLKQFGIYQKHGLIALLILQDLIQKPQYNLQVYASSATAQWIILSIIYYILAAKFRPMRQIPVLSSILKRYYQTRLYDESSRTIDGKQLCHFYNHIFLAKIGNIQPYQVDKMIDEAIVDNQAVANLIVTPIQSQDNTVLDNIAFSSSYEH